MSQPSVSKHLGVLREFGLVDVRTDAQRSIYRLRPARLAVVDAWIRPYRRSWNDTFDTLDRHLEITKEEQR